MGNPKFNTTEYESLIDEIIDLAAIRTFDEGYGPEDNGNNGSGRDGQGGASSREVNRAELAALRDSFSWIRETLIERPAPDPANFNLPIEYLERVPGTLGCNSWGDRKADDAIGDGGKKAYEGKPVSSKAMDTIARIETVGDDWDGHAATEFRDNVRIPLPYVMSNNTEVARALASAYERARAIYQAARDEVMGIARDTRDALADTSSGEDGSAGLSQAANMCTIAAGLATFWTGGGAAVATAASFTMLAGFTAERARQSSEDGDPPLDLGGDCVETILENMKNALIKYEENHQAVEGRLADALLDYLGGPEGGSEPPGLAAQSAPGKALIVKAPKALTNAPPAGEDRGDQFAPNTIGPWL